MRTLQDDDIAKALHNLSWPSGSNDSRRQEFLANYRQRAALRSAQHTLRRHRLNLGLALAACVALVVVTTGIGHALWTTQRIAENVLTLAMPAGQLTLHPDPEEGMGAGRAAGKWPLPVAVQRGTTKASLAYLRRDRANNTATVAEKGFVLLVDAMSGQILGATSPSVPVDAELVRIMPTSFATVQQVLPALETSAFFLRIHADILDVTSLPIYLDKTDKTSPDAAAVLVRGVNGQELTFVVDPATHTFLGASWSTYVTGIVLSSRKGAYIIGK